MIESGKGLFHTQEALHKMKVCIADHTVEAHVTLTLGGFFGEDVSFESFLESDLTATGDLEALLGAGVGFNLWHYITVLSYSLLALRTAGDLWSLVGNVRILRTGCKGKEKKVTGEMETETVGRTSSA